MVQVINEDYIKVTKDMYDTAIIWLDNDTDKIKFGIGVKQMDIIPPKLIMAGDENIFHKLKWEGMRVNINREYLNQFADSIFLISESLAEL